MRRGPNPPGRLCRTSIPVQLLRQALFFRLALAEALPETLPSLVTTGMRVFFTHSPRLRGLWPLFVLLGHFSSSFVHFCRSFSCSSLQLLKTLFSTFRLNSSQTPFVVALRVGCLSKFRRCFLHLTNTLFLFCGLLRHSSQVEFSYCDRVAKMRVDDHGCAPRKPLPDPRKPSPGWTRLLVTGRVVVARLSLMEREPICGRQLSATANVA